MYNMNIAQTIIEVSSPSLSLIVYAGLPQTYMISEWYQPRTYDCVNIEKPQM